MILIECLYDGKNSVLEISEISVNVKCGNSSFSMDYKSLKSLHVKNEEAFLIKIKADTHAAVLQFNSIHTRDLVKTIILTYMSIAEGITKNRINSNQETKSIISSLKGTISMESLNSSTKYNDSLFFQPGNLVIEGAPLPLNQVLVDVFVSMNCSLEQFFNLIRSSYFFDAKNQKNSFDRLLTDKTRNFGTSMNYATRINTHSLMDAMPEDKIDIKEPTFKGKEVEFSPVYYPLEDVRIERNDAYELLERPLVAKISPTFEKKKLTFVFDKKDFTVARDLCKLVYGSTDKKLIEEALKFSKSFADMVEGKYGAEGLNYAKALIPSFYIKKVEE